VTVELGVLISAGLVLAGAAATWGRFGQRLAGIERAFEKDQAATRAELLELRASRERQGERLGVLERRLAIDQAVRRATGAVPQTLTPEDE
jgi:hypothetical protein